MRKSLFSCAVWMLWIGFGAWAEDRALVVGVHYPKFPGQELAEAQEDGKDFARLLVDRYGFSERNIHLILGESATNRKVVSAFEALSKQARAGDRVVIYYSGHGTQVDDDPAQPDETDDQMDEALVTSDGEFIRGEGTLCRIFRASAPLRER